MRDRHGELDEQRQRQADGHEALMATTAARTASRARWTRSPVSDKPNSLVEDAAVGRSRW